MKFKLFGKSNKDKENEILSLFFGCDTKYNQLSSNLQFLLHNMEKLAKYGNFKDINLETKFEIEKFVGLSKKIISITITQN